MYILNRLGYVIGCLVFAMTAIPAVSAGAAVKPEACFAYPKPVISLSIDSRYKDGSKTRSDIDPEADAKVTAALRPVDDFIRIIVRNTNSQNNPDVKKRSEIGCIINAIDVWATADALSSMDTPASRIAVPSRVAGIAVAYGQIVSEAVSFPEQRSRIEDWLSRRADDTIKFFDTDAPTKASRNNLRAWAALGIAQTGILRKDKRLIDWAQETNRTMLNTSSADGSLPLEMGRAKFALHYQLHALTPLVTSTALLCTAGYGTGGFDLQTLTKVVRFSLEAVDNPAIVEKITSVPQKFTSGLKVNEGSIAWVEPYLALAPDEGMSLKIKSLRPVQNSKIGGDVTAIYVGRSISCKLAGG